MFMCQWVHPIQDKSWGGTSTEWIHLLSQGIHQDMLTYFRRKYKIMQNNFHSKGQYILWQYIGTKCQVANITRLEITDTIESLKNG